MNPSDTAQVLIKAALLDGRRPEPKTADVAAWHEIIGRFTLADCLDAIAQHHGQSTDWLTPAHVVALVEVRRRARMDRCTALHPNRPFSLTRNEHGQEIPADQADVERWRVESQELARLVLDGDWEPADVDDYRASGLDLADYRRRQLGAATRPAVTR
jgi:hypothetical protein